MGKTTCMYQVVRTLLRSGVNADRLWWLRLDHPLLIDWSLGDIVRQILDISKAEPDNPCFLFLDEIVYAKNWDLWLKTFYDDRYPVRIVATSSATAAPKERKLESGVGRWDENFLSPYVLTEYLQLIDQPVEVEVLGNLRLSIENAINADLPVPPLKQHWERLLLTGGFPELLLWAESQAAPELSDVTLESQRLLRNDAIERAVYKDIPQSFRVDKPVLLERLLYLLAGQMTGVLSPSTICRDLEGLSQPTFDRYLHYLEQAFLVFVLPNYSGSERAIQKRGRKLYFYDGAVRNAALQRGLGPLSDPGEMGNLVENLAAAHLKALAVRTNVRLHHWRDGNNEVDLIYSHPTHPVAFEIALSQQHSRKGLQELMNRHPEYVGNCFLVAPGAVAAHPATSATGVGTLPLDLFLAIVGAQTEIAMVPMLEIRDTLF
ncbi:MAG: ATP-binding protein [Acidimicrobiales bacterium]|nr:ATP-binding protein [Acidimicrobiales bacterium]